MNRSVIFVCTGNTCRSPMAEGIFRDLAGNHPEWKVQSAGIAAAEGYPASPETMTALRKCDRGLSNHSSQQLTLKHLEEATDIFVMTSSHMAVLLANFPEFADKISLVTKYSSNGEIEDPIGFDQNVYDKVGQQLETAIKAIIQHWESQ